MAQDINLRLANSAVIDISAASEDSEAAVNLGKSGLPEGATLTVYIEDGSAAAIEPLQFVLEITTDNGTTWLDLATVEVNTLAAQKYQFSAPCGLADIRPEQFADASIDVRVTARWTLVASADDVTYSAYLGGPTGFPPGN